MHSITMAKGSCAGGLNPEPLTETVCPSVRLSCGVTVTCGPAADVVVVVGAVVVVVVALVVVVVGIVVEVVVGGAVVVVVVGPDPAKVMVWLALFPLTSVRTI